MRIYNGWTEPKAQTEARARKIAAYREQLDIRDAMIAEVAPMLDTFRAAVAGTFTMDDEAAEIADWLDSEPIRQTTESVEVRTNPALNAGARKVNFTIEDITQKGFAFNGARAQIENDMRRKLADEYNSHFK